MKDLLERELNGELTPSEALELNRCNDDDTLVRRREWRDVADALSEEPSTAPTAKARIARGLKHRLAVRDAMEPARSTHVLPWAFAAACALLLAVGASWTEPELPIAEPEIEVTRADGPRTGPVEIQVAEVPSPEPDRLIEVVF